MEAGVGVKTIAEAGADVYRSVEGRGERPVYT